MGKHSNELLRLIRKAAAVYEINTISYYTGQVLDVNIPDRSCTVKKLTGNDISKIDHFADYVDAFGTPQEVPSDVQNEINSNFNDLIDDNVKLMACIDDGYMILPNIGSEVVVLTSEYQNAVVIQYSSISGIYNNSNALINLITSTPNNQSIFSQTATQILMSGGTQSNQLGINSVQSFLTNNKKVVLQTKSAKVEIDGGVINIENVSGGDNKLGNILSDLLTILETGVYAVSGATAIMNPDTVESMENIRLRISKLLKVDTP